MKFHQNFSGYTSILYSLIDFPERFLTKKTRLVIKDWFSVDYLYYYCEISNVLIMYDVLV